MGPPIDRLLDKCPTCHQGLQDPYRKTQKGGAHHFQGITEAGSRLSRYSWDSWAPHSRVLLHTTLISLGIAHQRRCPAGLRTSSALLPTWLQRSFLARCWQLPCPTCLLDLQTETLGLGFVIPHWLLCILCVCYISLGLLAVSRILMYVNVLLWVNLYSIQAEWTA